ncbi:MULTISPECIES: hypothetical protein [unclassified Pseudomonas]|uniref:hypothetical protein n=1 Tax=unclassified Pseudomonas TaxID=196821 RepID=UPI0021CCA1B6|nr:MULTISPECIES: hypothetical protein [unclassified Pseudomonas]
MQTSQRYMLTIYDLFTIGDGGICGADAEVAILDGGLEIDRMKFSGKCQSKEGYSRAYSGKLGLTAQLLSGPEGMSFAWGKAEVYPYQPVIAWRRRLSSPPDRDPAELDVQDGRAEYLLSGPYNLSEGGKIEVVGGKLLFTGSSMRIS